MLEPRDLAVAACVSKEWNQMAFALFQTSMYWTRRCGMSRQQFTQYIHQCKLIHAKNAVGVPKPLREYTVEPVLDEETETLTKITVVVCGLPGCGKTSFIRRFCSRSFDVADGKTKESALVKVKDVTIEVAMLELRATDSLEENEIKWKSADCAIILCDINNHKPDPIDMTQTLLNEWKNHCVPNKLKNVIIVTSKCDSRSSFYFTNASNMLHFASSAGIPFFASSAEEGFGVDEAVQFICMRKFMQSRRSSVLLNSKASGDADSGSHKEDSNSPSSKQPMRLPSLHSLSGSSSQSSSKTNEECRIM